MLKTKLKCQKIKNRTTEHVETCNYTFQREKPERLKMLKAKMKGQKLKNKNGNTLETSIKFQKTKKQND